jgi:hypothetical protein
MKQRDNSSLSKPNNSTIKNLKNSKEEEFSNSEFKETMTRMTNEIKEET